MKWKHAVVFLDTLLTRTTTSSQTYGPSRTLDVFHFAMAGFLVNPQMV